MSDELEKLQHELEAAQRALAEAEVRCARQDAEHQAETKKLEEVLKQVEKVHQEWMTALDVMEDPIFIHDKNFHILRCNRAYQRCAGIPFKQIIGQPYYEVFPITHAPLSHCLRVMGKSVTGEDEDEVLVWDKTYRSRSCSVMDGHDAYLYSVHILEDITEPLRAKQALQESEIQYRRLFEAAKDGILILDAETGKIVDANPFILDLLSYSLSECTGKTLWEIGLLADTENRKIAFKELQTRGHIRYEDLPLETKDGRRRAVEFVSNAYEVGGRKVIQCNIRDITERKRMEDALREQEEFFHMIAENGEDFIAVLDLEGRRIYNNRAYAKLFGDIEALKGTDSFAEIHPDDRERIQQVFKETVKSGIGHRTDFRFVLPNGIIRYIESRGGLIKNSQGEASCVVVVSHDITERKQLEDEIKNLAFYDPLTNLPNRRLFNDRLGQTMAASKRSGCYGALLFLDLDNFKPLNDAHGHSVGDLLLIEVADRLKSCVREMDTVARFGGDEFVVMLSELDADKAKSTTQAGIVAEKIRIALSEPYLLTLKHDGKPDISVEHHCTTSIGVTLFFNHDSSEDEVLKLADAAMYHAKFAGRNLIRFSETKA